MDYNSKTKEELINLVKYYRSEYDMLCRSLRQRNKEITKLKKEKEDLLKKLNEKENEQIEMLI